MPRPSSASSSPPPADLQLPLEIEEFLGWLAASQGRSANTLAAYRRDLRGYVAWLTAHGLDLGRVSGDDLVAWMADRRVSGLAPSTVARAAVAVRSLHRFLAAEGLADVDPSAELEATRVPRGLPKALAEDEVVRLLEAPVGDGPLVLRDRALLELLYGTGARISEVVGLSLADLDLEAGLVRVFGKGAKERIVPVGRMAAGAVSAWLGPGGRELVRRPNARRTDDDAVFLNARGGRLTRQGAWGIVERHARSVGLADRVTPHVLRHSCATHMVDHGADIRAVQELLGHASITTTQVYTKVSAERLRGVYLAAHPRATGRPRGAGEPGAPAPAR